MANTCTTCGTKVQHFLARCNEDFVQTIENTSSKFAPEGIPYPVFDLGVGLGALDSNSFFAVDGVSRNKVFCDQHALLGFGDENTRVPVGLDDSFCTSPGTPTSSTTATSTWTTPTSRGTTEFLDTTAYKPNEDETENW